MTACLLPAASPLEIASTPPRSHGLLPAVGEMVLRVQGPSHGGRTIRIRAAKCTVGAAAGCTLRLRSPDIGPVHCWILRGSAGTVVKQLHGQALLNGRALTEAALRIGDRLSIGPVELEVLECNEPALAPQPLFQAPEALGEAAALRGQVAALEERAKRLEAEARQGFESSIMAAERADQLRDALAAAHEQLEETCRELAAVQGTLQAQGPALEDHQRQLEELHTSQRGLAQELDAVGQQLRTVTQERDDAAAELNQLQAELGEARALVASREAAFQAEREQFGAERAAFESERTQLQRRLSQRDAEIEALRSSTAAQTGAMTVAITELSQTQRSLKEELNERFASLETQLAEKQAELAEKQMQLAQKQAELAEKQAQLDASRRTIEELEQAVSGQRDREPEIAELRLALDVKSRECGAREQDVRDLQTRIAALGDLATRQQELADGVRELAEREARLETTQEGFAAREAEIAAHQQELRALREQLEEERNELLLQRQELDEARERLTTREFQISEYESRLAAAAAQVRPETVEQQCEDGEREQYQREQAELDQRAAELAAQQAEAARRLEDLGQLQEACVAERAALADRRELLEQRQSELDAREAQLVAQAEALEERLAAARAAQTPETVQAAEQVSSAEAATCAESNRLWSESEFAAGDQDAAEHGAPVNMTANWTPEGFAALMNRSEPAAEDSLSACGLSPASQPAEAEASPRDSGEVDDVLGRLVRAGLWRTDGDAAPASESAGQDVGGAAEPAAELPSPSGTDELFEPPAAAVAPAGAGHVSAAAGGDDEESIESYMERLMKRVRGDGPAVKEEWKPEAPLAAQPELPPEEEPVSLKPAKEAPAAEYSPRRTAPELNENLTAMRELANKAARSAIDQHVRQRTVRQAMGKLIGACTTVTVSIVLGYWTYRVQSFPAAVAAGIGGAVGTYWTLAAMRRLGTLRRINREQELAEQAKKAQTSVRS